ncbi:lactate permease [Paraburkholderia youngii]
MFHQLLTPVGNSLFASFIVAALPIIVVLALLGWARRPAWQASLAGLIVGLIVAIFIWQFPVGLALNSVAAGVVFAIWPVMWIVFTAILLYNIAQRSGRFEAFRLWMIDNLPNDRRIVLVVVGFSFGALLEGISGFGTPVAITSSLLIMLGFPTLEALVFTLIFNTAPVAFGALGVPITVLGAVTHLPSDVLGKMVGRQLPFFAVLLPFYVIGVYAGFRNMLRIWPVLLVSGLSFALTQFVVSNFVNYSLTDVLSSLVSLILTVAFLRVWKPVADPKFAINVDRINEVRGKISGVQGWYPWIIVSVVVIVWTVARIFTIGDVKVSWPGLDKAVFITLYNTPYGAIWDFQPLATGTAILVAALITAFVVRLSPAEFGKAISDTWVQTRIAILTVATIVGLRVSDELLGPQLHARPRRRIGRAGVSARVGVPWLGRGVPVGQRYVGQCAVRQSAGGGGQAAQSESGADGGDQLVGRRDGQNDLAAEHFDRRRDHRLEGQGRRRVRQDLQALDSAHGAARRARVGAAELPAMDDSALNSRR